MKSHATQAERQKHLFPNLKAQEHLHESFENQVIPWMEIVRIVFISLPTDP